VAERAGARDKLSLDMASPCYDETGQPRKDRFRWPCTRSGAATSYPRDNPRACPLLSIWRQRSRTVDRTSPLGFGREPRVCRLRGELRCVDEPAREVIAEQRASGGRGTWDQDPSLFVSLLLERSIEKYKAARGSGERVLFDRGIPDCVVYAIRAGADPGPSLTAVDAFRYAPHVLFLEPWSDIYTTDEERIMSFEDTVSFSEALGDVYRRSGYVVVDVPQKPIDARVAFVRRFVARLR
jgi:predicted ATPase